MGCGGSEEKQGETVVVAEHSEAMMKLAKMVKAGDGTRLMQMYQKWPVDGEAKDVKLADGSTRKSWPQTWAELEKEFAGLHNLVGQADGAISADEIAAIKAETVDNADKPHVTADCVSWPAIQNVFRDAWVIAFDKPWDPAEHEEGMDYFCLLRKNTLAIKVEGLSKLIHEQGATKSIDMMWEIYAAWPNPFGEEQECARMNRKKGTPEIKKTWPLPFEGEKSVTSVLTECGWSEMLIAALKTQLIDRKEDSGVHANCTEAEICWPDLQQAFRAAVSEDGWDDEKSGEWPPLAPFVTLRLKIPKEKIVEMLAGEWRMYCKPDEGDAFSYGLVVEEVDIENWTFKGKARTADKYVCENGKMVWNEKNHRLRITYEEVWPNGQRDALAARVKSNGKFQCESAAGYEQKATREDLNLPSDAEERIGENAPDGIKKYYTYDHDAAHEAGGGA